MHSLFRVLKKRELLMIEGPTLAASLLIAELAFKFHSFTLECLAFLVTWAALGAAARRLLPRGAVTTESETT